MTKFPDFDTRDIIDEDLDTRLEKAIIDCNTFKHYEKNKEAFSSCIYDISNVSRKYIQKHCIYFNHKNNYCNKRK